MVVGLPGDEGAAAQAHPIAASAPAVLAVLPVEVVPQANQGRALPHWGAGAQAHRAVALAAVALAFSPRRSRRGYLPWSRLHLPAETGAGCWIFGGEAGPEPP